MVPLRKYSTLAPGYAPVTDPPTIVTLHIELPGCARAIRSSSVVALVSCASPANLQRSSSKVTLVSCASPANLQRSSSIVAMGSCASSANLQRPNPVVALGSCASPGNLQRSSFEVALSSRALPTNLTGEHVGFVCIAQKSRSITSFRLARTKR
ncbi:hypothetical protein PoB_001480000 [Plakobranchus ocellatus]|uniref:Uncharacterized protein n=1 Tax=Plakobranchus ocellatus TaxID=259542 RepID=A0AAV3YYL8_9GAST|nr:hypothetical protein PoB_001480000 [Plakobranchus ocellatus]